MQVIRTGHNQSLTYNYPPSPAVTKTVYLLDVNLALHDQFGAMLQALERGLGRLDEVAALLSNRIRAKVLQMQSDPCITALNIQDFWMVVVASVNVEGPLPMRLLKRLLEQAMRSIFLGDVHGEPVFWIGNGFHSRPKWMAWHLNEREPVFQRCGGATAILELADERR